MDADREQAKSQFSEMGVLEKTGYIIRYYGVRILLAVAAIALIITMIGRFTWNKEKDRVLGVGIHSAFYDPDLIQELAGDLNENYSDMTEEASKEFKIYPFYNGYTQAEGEEALAIRYKLAGSIEAGQLDVLIGDLDSLSVDAQSCYLMDLRMLFTEEELALIEEAAAKRSKDGKGIVYLDYYVTNDQGRMQYAFKDVPYLINITGCDPELSAVLLDKETYVSVLYNTKEVLNAKTMIFRLLDLEIPENWTSVLYADPKNENVQSP